MNKIYIIIVFLLITSYSFSQTITGTVFDTKGNPLVLANVVFKEANNPESVKEFVSIRNGKYNIILKKNYEKILVEINSDGYFTEKQLIDNPNTTKTYELNFQLAEDITELKEIKIITEKKAIIVKEDTLKYNVSKFRDGSERKIEDIIKKLPGISVNEKTGEIKYKGKSIEAVTLDGDNMFGYNYSLGTKNINVDMVEQVQAIDNFSENLLLKGIENGDKVSLNLKLKKSKTDYSGNIDFGLGVNSDKKKMNNSIVNILQISKGYKAFGTFSYNNVGGNNSPFDYFSGTQNIEQSRSKSFETYRVIPETLFSNIIDNTRTNNNNLFFSNYNSLFKISKRISVKTNFYYLHDNINFQQATNTINTINSETFTTSDNNTSNKKPNLYRGDLEVKFNSSKNSLLEYKTKFNLEETFTNITILANQTNQFYSNLKSKNQFFNQNLIFTKKISDKKVIQININQGFNNTPQFLRLNSITETNNQNSNFKKNYIDGVINILGTTENFKYSFSVGANYEKTPFTSFNNYQNNISSSIIDENKTIYFKKSLYHLGSVNYNINRWILSPSYSIKFLKQSLQDNILNQKEDTNDFIFEPALLLKFKINSLSFISSRLSNSQNPVVDEFIFRNSVITNNRLKVSNNPDLDLQKPTLFSLNYNNNNVYRQFQFEVGFSYQKSKGNFYSDYNINQTETNIKNIFLLEKNDNYNADVLLAKYLPIIATTIKLKTNYSYSNYFNLVNSTNLRENTSNIILNELSIRTAFKAKINFDNNFINIKNTNKNSDLEKITNNSIINTFKIRYKPTKKIFAVLSSDYYLPDTNNKNNNYLFLDANITFKPNNKHLEMNLSAKNLLNKKVFSQIQTTDFSKSTFQNNLISRYIFINVTYDL
ncbi:hypothetical protein [Flavobacterium sp. W20_MBD1_R3]|uniref:hypothetical protein n=1 Tax=Flavobacterium sp. W20_MBD1_R3 TaxID=3240278 RepID=UPI003F93A127